MAPKSNASYMALNRASEEVSRSGELPVPKNLRNAVTGLMRRLGYGRGYVYAHGHQDEAAAQQHLPDRIRDKKFFQG
jgi:putative ATPase